MFCFAIPKPIPNITHVYLVSLCIWYQKTIRTLQCLSSHHATYVQPKIEWRLHMLLLCSALRCKMNANAEYNVLL